MEREVSQKGNEPGVRCVYKQRARSQGPGTRTYWGRGGDLDLGAVLVSVCDTLL